MKTAFVIVHGFLSTPKSVLPIKRELIKHGVESKDIFLPKINASKYEDTIFSLKKQIEEVERGYSSIVLVGYSMGGLISIGAILKLKNKSKVSRLVLLNAPISIWSVKSFFYTVKNSKYKKKIYHIKTVLSSFKLKKIINNIELTKLRKYVKTYLKRIEVPTLVVQMKHDYVAKPESGRYIYECISSKTKEYLEYDIGTHFVPDDSAEVVTKDMVNWLKTLDKLNKNV